MRQMTIGLNNRRQRPRWLVAVDCNRWCSLSSFSLCVQNDRWPRASWELRTCTNMGIRVFRVSNREDVRPKEVVGCCSSINALHVLKRHFIPIDVIKLDKADRAKGKCLATSK